MSNRINRINAIIDNHIYVWSSVPSFAPMAEILRTDRDMLAEKLLELTGGEVPKGGGGHDAVRLFLIDFALERMAGQITSEHFTMFRNPETVQAILEDSYGPQIRANRDEMLIPHQDEALKILIQCLFHRAGPLDEKDLLCFFHMFCRQKPEAYHDRDRMMRFRSMLWFIYLAIEIANTERAVCSKGLEYFSDKFRQLLDRTVEGTLINEQSGRPGLEEGKWDKTLFGWLQGKGRREFARKIKFQFNMENRIDHAPKRLLADHRNSMLEQTMITFCKQVQGEDSIRPVTESPCCISAQTRPYCRHK